MEVEDEGSDRPRGNVKGNDNMTPSKTLRALCKLRLLAAIVLALTCGTGLVLVNNGGKSDSQRVTARGSLATTDTMPPQKQALVAGAVGLEGELAGNVATLQSSFSDSGPTDQVAAVKLQVPARLTEDRATLRVPLNEGDISQRLGAPLNAIWTTAARAVQYQEKYNALQAILKDHNYQSYSDNRFIVDSWSGVNVNGTSAFALLEGHDEYYDASGWQADAAAQWQVSMTLESGVWKLADTSVVDHGSN